MQERNIIGSFTAAVLAPFVEGWQQKFVKQQDMEWTEIILALLSGTTV